MAPTSRTIVRACRCSCRACAVRDCGRRPPVSDRRIADIPPQRRLSLREGGMLKIQGGPALRIEALQGRLWIIQEADVADVELEAGQSLQTGNVTLIQALKASTLA